MHLNHINLCSSDVPALAEKLVTHFGYHLIDSGEIPRHDGSGAQQYACVAGADHSELVITQIDPAPENTSSYPKGFHFGLMQNTRDDVLAKHEELTTAGLEPGRISDAFEVWGAIWTAFYCPLGDGLEIEINYRTHSDLLDGGAKRWSGRCEC